MTRARDIANYGDGIDTSSITSGTFADARIAASNVTQHEGSIDALASNPTVTLGSNATLPDGTMCGFTETTMTPTAIQGTDTSYTPLTGSTVNYTPVSGSSFVVYNYQTCFTNADTNSLIYFKFYYHGSEVANTNHAFYAHFGSGDGGYGYETFTFVLPSWSGSKELKLEYRVHGSSYTARIHKSSYSEDATPNDVYTKIYRQTYSVM